jgi:hypothetical protein
MSTEMDIHRRLATVRGTRVSSPFVRVGVGIDDGVGV